MLGRLDDGTNESSTKRLMFQVLFFFHDCLQRWFQCILLFFIDLQKSKQRVLSALSLKEIIKKKQCVEYQMLGQ